MTPKPSPGLTDEAALGVHDVIHHAEAEQHEHDAALKRGLPDDAIDAEREGLQMFEKQNMQKTGPVAKAKEVLHKIIPGSSHHE
jgi:hypothetical protein